MPEPMPAADVARPARVSIEVKGRPAKHTLRNNTCRGSIASPRTIVPLQSTYLYLKKLLATFFS